MSSGEAKPDLVVVPVEQAARRVQSEPLSKDGVRQKRITWTVVQQLSVEHRKMRKGSPPFF